MVMHDIDDSRDIGAVVQEAAAEFTGFGQQEIRPAHMNCGLKLKQFRAEVDGRVKIRAIIIRGT